MIRIGISGWRYEPWRGVFYPEDLPQRRELEFAARRFPTIEINGSFYSLQRPEYYAAWYDATPPGFVFAVKGSRYITHLRRLREIEAPLINFFDSGVFALRDKLGPILWQFPPSFRFDAGRLEPFFELLPRDTHARRKVRHAIEIRHPSFMCEELVALLRRHDIGLVVADTAGKWPKMFDVTSDFVYVRLHGDVKIYTSGYTKRALEQWARRIRTWDRDGRDVYVYFDNDVKVRAPFDALALMKKLRLADETGPVLHRRRRPRGHDARPAARPRWPEYRRAREAP